MDVRLELLENDMVGVTFDYHAGKVGEIRRLTNRRWNARKRRWEVHVAHLGDLRRIFDLAKGDVPDSILEGFEKTWADGRLRVRLDALHGRLSGAGAPNEAIDEATSFFLPGHSFSPKFKAKRWDGKRHLYNKRSMKFPAGLWPRVKEVLVRNGKRYVVEEAVAEESDAIECGEERKPLRPYQAKALESAVRHRRGIIQLATGGGKTLLAAHLIRRLGRRTFFFVHTRELLYQAARVFEEELGVEIGLLGDGHAELADVTVATLQTTARCLGEAYPRRGKDEEEEPGGREARTSVAEVREEMAEAIQRAGLVIFDECHHVPAETAYKIAFKTPRAAYRFGLSATPWRDDNHDLLLEAALGPKVAVVNCSELIEQGYLVKPRITMELAPAVRMQGRRLPYSEVYRLGIVENQSRNRVIATRARQWADEGRSLLILVARIDHGERLLELMPEARFVHGSLDMEVRRLYLEELEQKLRPILIATSLADEGLDVPSLGGMILAGGGKSATKAYQRIGRTLRPAPGKKEALVMDFMDRGPYIADHSVARLNLYRYEPGFEIQTEGFQA